MAAAAKRVSKGIHHVSVRAKDFDRSMKFYKEGLGLTEKMWWGEKPGRAVMLDVGGGSCLEVFERPNEVWADKDACLLHVALASDDAAASLERACAAGAVVTMEPKDIDLDCKPQPIKIRIAFCKGPDGEVIEFFQQKK